MPRTTAVTNLVSVQNLKSGIAGWPWCRDFHNQTYLALTQAAANGFTNTWWLQTVDRLSIWKANRGRSKGTIQQAGLASLANISHEYAQLKRMAPNGCPSIVNINWNQAYPLFQLAADIKGVRSPVFASKLCHFMCPAVYPVIDGKAVGIMKYVNYWKISQVEWNNCPVQGQLISILRNEILKHPATTRVFPGYPYCTKITELCWIGHKAAGGQTVAGGTDLPVV